MPNFEKNKIILHEQSEKDDFPDRKSSSNNSPENKNIASEEDVESWLQGGDWFRKFWENTEQLHGQRYSQHELGCLQAMFLGEKPAIFNLNIIQDLKNELEAAGISIVGNYAFRQDLVEKKYLEYANIFQNYGISSPDQIINTLDMAKGEDLGVVRGLVLGFPLKATIEFERELKMKIHKIATTIYQLLSSSPEEQAEFEAFYFTNNRFNRSIIPFFEEKVRRFSDRLNLKEEDIQVVLNELHYITSAKEFNVKGIVWTDYGDTTESERKKARLETAFIVAGL